MPHDNQEQLNKLLKIINTDKIVSPDEIEQVIAALTKVLANNKKELEGKASELAERMESFLSQVKEEHGRMATENTQHSEDSRRQANQEVKARIDMAVSEIKRLGQEIQNLRPKDGQDADEERVIGEVLTRIKLPEQKEVLLDGGKEIVQKINDLPTDDDEDKIDASHIKGLKADKDGKVVYGAIRGPEVQIYDLSSQLNGVLKTFSLPAFRLIFDVRSSSFPYAFRPTVDYTVDYSLMKITFTSQIEASSTLGTGQTLYVLFLTA